MRIDRTVRHATCVLVALLLAGSLAACGGSGDSSESAAGVPDRAPGGIAGGAAGNRTGGTQSQAGAGAQEAPAAARTVVYTASLRVRAGNVDQAAAKAKQLTLAAGGYVENESSRSGSSATIALKIPSDRYPTVLNDLARLGTRLSLSQKAEDVTREVADVDSRVRSAQATLESFRKLLDRTRTVEEIISVEEKISERQAELEALQARQKALQHSTRYATATLTLVGPLKAAKDVDEDDDGFLSGLKNGWEDFTTFMSGLAVIVGWLLPFLGLAAVIALPVTLVWRRIQRQRTSGLPPK
jgi:hypothetical protein